MRSERAVVDVSGFPTVVFGHRASMWWGICGFIVIEGTTLALCAASYLYLRRNFDAWPPPRTPNPALLVPTLNLALMLLSVVPARMAANATRRLDLRALRRWLIGLSAFGVLIVTLRAFEFTALRTTWNADAYGSAAWVVVGFHATLLLMDVADTLAFTVLVWGDRMEKKHFADAEDNSLYWYFMVASWVPLYVLVFLSPRWM
jgi:heme/copper-type cytochrome/quinol oxidase subunit 3